MLLFQNKPLTLALIDYIISTLLFELLWISKNMNKNLDKVELLKSFGLSLEMSKEVAWQTLYTNTATLELSYVAGRRAEDDWYNYFLPISNMDFNSVKFSNTWAVRFSNQEPVTFQFIDNKLMNLNARLYDGKGELKDF
jgi:hypothetical protein